MKSWITYIKILITSCLLMTSCIEEEFDVISKEKVNLRLEIAVPANQNYTRAESTEEDVEKNGNDYENTIPNKEAIKIYVFDDTNKQYLCEATILDIKGAINSIYRTVNCTVPIEYLNRKIRLVFMANYQKRDANSVKAPNELNPAVDNYNDWKDKLIFNYGNKSWKVKDQDQGKYIPMSGETTFTLSQNYVAHVDLVRAIAKVRVEMKDGTNSEFKILSIQTNNASDRGYCLKQDTFNVPSPIDAMWQTLNFNNLGKQKGVSKYEYYIPEQINVHSIIDKQTTLQIQLTDGKDPKNNIEFKIYPDGATYNIERNHIYVFRITKKPDEAKADVQVNIMPWTAHDINSDYE